MKLLKKIIRMLNWCEDMLVYLLCLLLFLFGTYAMYDSYLVYQHANDNSLLRFKPGYVSEKSEERKIQGNMVAWVTLENTNIDYPVMQGKDNSEYLNKDPYGEYSLSGSIFLDQRNTPDFCDSYSLLYGHHMEGDRMFGGLHRYLDEAYYQEHRKGELTVGEMAYDIQIFAVLQIDATQEEIFSVTEYEVPAILSFIKEHAIYCDSKIAEQEEISLLAMSTCKAPDTAERVVVVGVLEQQK